MDSSTRPEIEAYLREHGATYTTDSLRRQLLTAGYDAAEVDTALAETEEVRRPQLGRTKGRRSQFWLWAFLINVVVLVGVTILTAGSSYAGAVSVVLGIALLIGIAVSGSIGRALLPRTGLLVALVLPAVAALLLGGWCVAMTGVTQHTTKSGTMTLKIDPPLAFSGSGAATCDIYPSSFIINAYDLGSVGDKVVRVSVGSTSNPGASASDPNASVQSPAAERGALLEIDMINESTGSASSYGQRRFPLHAAADAVSGTITFEGLIRQLTEPGPVTDPDSISGTVTWTCS